ncbi:MAG: bacteriophage holin [candidate division SR1 bacterium]|nr:bacteriophage holin [candidate division SR1 bacterium]
MDNSKVKPLAAALAVGIYFGVGLFLIGLLARLTGYCKIFVAFMSTFYIGYNYTFGGAFMGLIWGALDGFVGTYIVVRLYNLISKKLK